MRRKVVVLHDEFDPVPFLGEINVACPRCNVLISVPVNREPVDIPHMYTTCGCSTRQWSAVAEVSFTERM
jgi:hypothetical protein